MGYFFSQRYEEVPTLDAVRNVRPRDAIRVMLFGDLGLIKKQWPVTGQLAEWRPVDWPLPNFGRRELSGRAFKVVYDESDLRGPVREEPISAEECDRLPRDALSGAGAVERVLTELLST